MLRIFNLMVLCLALVVGSVSMAVARGQAAALSNGGTTLVICSGYGVMTVTLDDQGNPVGPVHPCPDCLAGIAAYLPSGLPVLAPILPAGKTVDAYDLPIQARAAAVFATRARGPPLEG